MISKQRKKISTWLPLLLGVFLLIVPKLTSANNNLQSLEFTGPIEYQGDKEWIVLGQDFVLNATLIGDNVNFAINQEDKIHYALCASAEGDHFLKQSFGIFTCEGLKTVGTGVFDNKTLEVKTTGDTASIKNLTFHAAGLATTDRYFYLGIIGTVRGSDGKTKNITVEEDKIDLDGKIITQEKANALVESEVEGGEIDSVTGFIKGGLVHLIGESGIGKTSTLHVTYYTGSKSPSEALSSYVINATLCKCSIDKIDWRYDNNDPLVYTNGVTPQPPVAAKHGEEIDLDRSLLKDNDIRVNVTLTYTATGKTLTYTDTQNVDSLLQPLALTNSQGESAIPEMSLLGVLSKMINFIVYLLLTIVYTILQSVLTPLLQTLLSIQVHAPDFSAAIIAGWVTVRNITNIFFILALLAMSVGTLFDLHGYSYKELLGRLVLMALLVNFSLIIARVILGVADTIQAQFIPFGDPTVINNLAYQMIVHPLQTLLAGKNDISVLTGVNDIISGVIYLILGLAAFMAFLALTIFLVIRICAMMILLVTSPIAYAGTVFGEHTAIGKLGHEWWDNFIKYAFFTPIIAFFLHMAAVIANEQSKFLSSATTTAFPTAPNQVFAQGIYNILSNVIIVALIFAGIRVAKSFDIEGVNKVVDKFSGGFKAGGNATLGYLNASKQRATAGLVTDEKGLVGSAKRLVFKAANPVTSLKASQERWKEDKDRAATVAKGAAKRATYFVASKGLVDNKANLKALNEIDDKDAEYYKDKDKIAELKKINDPKLAIPDDERMHRKALLMRAAMQKGDMKKLVEDKFGKGQYNSENLVKYLAEHLGNYKESKRFLESINKTGKDENRVALIGFNKIDLKNANDPKKLGDMLESMDEEQTKFIDDKANDEMVKLNYSGVETHRTDQTGKNRVPAKRYYKTVEKIKDGGTEVKVTREMMKLVGPAEIETSTGTLIFNKDEDGKMFDQLRNSKDSADQQAALRIYNAAIGAKWDGSNGVKDISKIPKDFLIKKGTGASASYATSRGAPALGTVNAVPSMNPVISKLPPHLVT